MIGVGSSIAFFSGECCDWVVLRVLFHSSLSFSSLSFCPSSFIPLLIHSCPFFPVIFRLGDKLFYGHLCLSPGLISSLYAIGSFLASGHSFCRTVVNGRFPRRFSGKDFSSPASILFGAWELLHSTCFLVITRALWFAQAVILFS